ncbi:hypothetical protein K1719_047531 [Acacia pycnantha]|nr:hypothetical protein K1719_047531 [Acacia pycnantha]
MSTAQGVGGTRSSRVFKGREEAAGHHATSVLFRLWTTSRLSRFREGWAVLNEERELFPEAPDVSDSHQRCRRPPRRFGNFNQIPFRSTRAARYRDGLPPSLRID